MSNTARIAATAANTLTKPLNIEDVFSTYLYNGTGSSQTITNGIDLDGEGGLVWMKARSTAESHILQDTDGTGVGNVLLTNSTSGMISVSGTHLSAFNSNGFSIGTSTDVNRSGTTMASWTFRKAPKFFDVVTYTGNGTAGRTISHNLGSVPGCIIVKKTSGIEQWNVYHKGYNSGVNPQNYRLFLDSTSNGGLASGSWNNTAPTSTEFTVGSGTGTNQSGQTYVAYLFAHNDGDGEFGSTADQDIIKCGSYTGTGTAGLEINLGFEPQWFLMKRTDTAGADWFLFDVMRGFDASGNPDRVLRANTSEAESNAGPAFRPIANGVEVQGTFSSVNASGGTYIYIAIRRGPMAVPESATDVFAIDEMDNSPTAPPTLYSGFPVDMAFYRDKSTTSNTNIHSRLTGTGQMQTNLTASETSYTYSKFDYMDGWFSYAGALSNYYSWMWKRAPNYFDVVAYSGTGVARTINHNLGAVPEMMWVKSRTNTRNWMVYHKDADASPESGMLRLDGTQAFATGTTTWNNTQPTASVFSVGTRNETNNASETFIAYLFASLDGVSKVGSYTGDSTTGRVIDCGFTSGARFVLIKRTDGAGDWAVWDSERGIVAGNDPRLRLNDTSAEVTGYDILDPHSSGFIVNHTAALAANESGQSYIFYAIA